MTTRRGSRGSGRKAGGGGAARWTDRAKQDLSEMGDYIAQDNPAAAEQWVEALLELAERAARLPRSGRRVPEMGRDDVRELILGSYRLVYRLVDELIDVLAVFEGHRRLPAYVVEAEAEEPSGR